jgi:hypothetical protein
VSSILEAAVTHTQPEESASPFPEDQPDRQLTRKKPQWCDMCLSVRVPGKLDLIY